MRKKYFSCQYFCDKVGLARRLEEDVGRQPLYQLNQEGCLYCNCCDSRKLGCFTETFQ